MEKTLNIITLGDAGVGKTSIINKNHIVKVFLLSKKNMKKES